ncbi:MAG: GNAT family N-acetyltransferase [Chloroflexi bacterium]|jgi:ribosomal protein S18 acetylase RimI-like enzyme|nr:GNAT family N-acetyltransferase [Chloroflexota bacterium]
MSSDSINIRSAVPSDCESVAALVYRSHTVSFNSFASSEWVSSRQLGVYRSKWRELLSDHSQDAATFIAVVNDAVVGTVRVSPIETSNHGAQLSGMHVEPSQTGNGIGGLLMTRAIAFIKERGFDSVELGVIASNSGARRFYETHGWEVTEELPDGIEGVPIAIYKLA